MSEIARRLTELAERSDKRGIWVFSDFLTLAEQAELKTLRLASKCSLEGGYRDAERRIAVFGSAEELGYESESHIVCLAVEPVNQRFAESLGHRDILGAVMSLGVKREMLGDIVIYNNVGYLFALDTVERYIAEQLTKVRRTGVTVKRVDAPPELAAALPEIETVIAASKRLDALISGVYDLSRTESRELVEQGAVRVNGGEVLSASAEIAKGDIVSVRGLGRFLYEGAEGETRSGRLRAAVRRY